MLLQLLNTTHPHSRQFPSAVDFLINILSSRSVACCTQGETHINLRAPKVALIACAKYGRGFQGLTASQVVLALRVYAAERIQAQWRGRRPRRIFAPKTVALRELVRREQALRVARRTESFNKWSHGHRARMELLRGTRRPFRLLRLEAVRSRRRADLFRGTFWPLYVWRRWTNYRISSVDKVGGTEALTDTRFASCQHTVEQQQAPGFSAGRGDRF